MFEHDLGDRPEVRRVLGLASREDIRQIAEEPRTTQAAATDHHAVASGLPHHPKRVLGLPDVAVAQHRDGGDDLLQAGDGLPARLAVVELRRRPRVQGDRCAALFLPDASGVLEGEQVVVDAHPELDGHGHVAGA